MDLLPPIDLTTYPEHQSFLKRDRQRQGAREFPVCWLCGAYCTANPPMLQLAGGGFTATDPNDPNEDPWHQPIGPNCLKKHPELLPYVVSASIQR
jgi:hypothetical protein